jgi:hypothetical protein
MANANPVFKMSDIGPNGLVVYDGHFKFVKEQTWRQFLIASPTKELLQLAQDGAVASKLGSQGTFINLRTLSALVKPQSPTDDEPGPRPVPKDTPPPPREGDAVVVVGEKVNDTEYFYAVGASDLQPIPPGFEGDAGVLVSRGAVVAIIPQNVIQTGSWCILINTASIVR